MIAPSCKQRFLPGKHTCPRESLQQIFHCKIAPLCVKVPRALSSLPSVTGSDPSLLSLGRHQHFKGMWLGLGNSCGILVPQAAWFGDESLHLLCLSLPCLTSLLFWATAGHKGGKDTHFTATTVASCLSLVEDSRVFKRAGWRDLLGSRSVACGIAPFLPSLYTVL